MVVGKPSPQTRSGTPWKRHLIKDSGKNKHHDQLFGDYDGDGAMELVFWNQTDGKLFLAEIPEKPATHQGEWPMNVIYTYGMDSEMEQTGQAGYPGWKGTNEQEGLFADDIDGMVLMILWAEVDGLGMTARVDYENISSMPAIPLQGQWPDNLLKEVAPR